MTDFVKFADFFIQATKLIIVNKFLKCLYADKEAVKKILFKILKNLSNTRNKLIE